MKRQERQTLIFPEFELIAAGWTMRPSSGRIEGMAYGKMRTARKGRNRSPKPTRDSIRVKLGHGGGPWTLDQLRAMIIDALDQAERLGMTHISRANLYLNPVDSKGNVATVIDRQPLPDLDIKRPYRSAAEEHGL